MYIYYKLCIHILCSLDYPVNILYNILYVNQSTLPKCILYLKLYNIQHNMLYFIYYTHICLFCVVV